MLLEASMCAGNVDWQAGNKKQKKKKNPQKTIGLKIQKGQHWEKNAVLNLVNCIV